MPVLIYLVISSLGILIFPDKAKLSPILITPLSGLNCTSLSFPPSTNSFKGKSPLLNVPAALLISLGFTSAAILNTVSGIKKPLLESKLNISLVVPLSFTTVDGLPPTAVNNSSSLVIPILPLITSNAEFIPDKYFSVLNSLLVDTDIGENPATF